MINPSARKAMFEKFHKRLVPRFSSPVSPMPGLTGVLPTMASPMRNPRMRYAFGGEVPNPGGIPTPGPGPMPAYQPPGRTPPDPRMPPNALMPGPTTGTGQPSRPDPLAGWVSPYGPQQPQAGTGTTPGFQWPDPMQQNKPDFTSAGGGFGNGKIQTFNRGGRAEGGFTGTVYDDFGNIIEGASPSWFTSPTGQGPTNNEPSNFSEPVSLNQNPEGGSSTAAYGGDNLNSQIAAEGGDVQGEYGPGFNPATFFYGITPPQGTPGAPQGNTMIPTTFDSQGYPYAVYAGPEQQGSLAGTNYWSNPSDPSGLQNISGGHIESVNKGEKVPNPRVPLQGYGKDTVPAALTPGEVIIPKPGDTSNARRKYLLKLAKKEK